MKEAKIEGKFYPLQHQEWLRACRELTPAELKVLYYIRTADPYSNGVRLTAAAIARDLSCEGQTPVSRQTVSRAVKNLDKLGYIDMEPLEFHVRLCGKGILIYQDPDGVSTHHDGSPHTKGVSTHQKRSSRTRNDHDTPETIVTHQPQVETLALQGVQPSKTLKTNKTKKDFFQTLSESEEREKKEILISETSFSEEKSEKEKSKKQNIDFFNDLSGRQKEAVIRTAQKYFLPRLNMQPALPISWIKCHAIEVAMTDAYKKEFDLVLLAEQEIEIFYTVEDIKKMHPECWEEILPYYGASLAF
jgi:hypothetical protein